jgi:hypothetical protein
MRPCVRLPVVRTEFPKTRSVDDGKATVLDLSSLCACDTDEVLQDGSRDVATHGATN